MTLLNPIFNNNTNKPYRWALEYIDSGDIIEAAWLADNKFVHWTTKPIAVQRNVFTDISPYSVGNFTPMRKRYLDFLTTHHTNMYEDGKYTEVYNDPVNYIFAEDQTYTAAYLTAEARIGNYRSGVRRHITHLGGTLSEDELSMLKDNQVPPVTLSSFPLFPPLPTTNFVLPFRTKLITSDVGYIDYIKAAHPNEETATDKYAYQAKQTTGYRHIVFDAGHTNMISKGTVINSVSKVDVEDIETLVDPAISTATDTDAVTFLPLDGEYTIYNIKAKTVLRMDETTGISLEQYDKPITPGSTLGVLQSYINVDISGGVVMGAGDTTITLLLDGTVTIDTSTSGANIILNAGAGDVEITAGDLNITGGLIVSGATDLNSTLNVSGTTTHGG